MPTYEYQCTECKHQWEEIQAMRDPKIEVCPNCQKQSAERLISCSSFQLKGSGWSADNYK